MIFSTQQVIKMLGLTALPDEFTQSQYAEYRRKSPQAVSRELTLKQRKGEVAKVRQARNKWGEKINVYRFVRNMPVLA
jgi:hypothetical protein